jgi:hypothetical protein
MLKHKLCPKQRLSFPSLIPFNLVEQFFRKRFKCETFYDEQATNAFMYLTIDQIRCAKSDLQQTDDR